MNNIEQLIKSELNEAFQGEDFLVSVGNQLRLDKESDTYKKEVTISWIGFGKQGGLKLSTMQSFVESLQNKHNKHAAGNKYKYFLHHRRLRKDKKLAIARVEEISGFLYNSKTKQFEKEGKKSQLANQMLNLALSEGIETLDGWAH